MRYVQKDNQFESMYLMYYKANLVTSEELSKEREEYEEWQSSEEGRLLRSMDGCACNLAAYDIEHGNKPRFKDIMPAPDPAPLPSGALPRLRWLGTPSSWERVYEALTDAGLIDPSATAWAEHFITETGEPMPRPRGGSAVAGEAKEPKVRAAVALIRKQE